MNAIPKQEEAGRIRLWSIVFDRVIWDVHICFGSINNLDTAASVRVEIVLGRTVLIMADALASIGAHVLGSKAIRGEGSVGCCCHVFSCFLHKTHGSCRNRRVSVDDGRASAATGGVVPPDLRSRTFAAIGNIEPVDAAA
jgi:hypothetical protein